MKENRPFVSIIIPTLNEEKYIKKCLDSLFNLNYPKTKYEIILVDNSSTDGTLEIARQHKIKIFIKPKITIGALRNFGTRYAKGEVFAFIDADCEAEREWLNKALQNLKKSDITGNRYIAPKKGTIIQKAWNLHYNKNQKKRGFIPGGNMIMKKEVFNLINGFDESLKTGEDIDICFRFKKKGKIIYKDNNIYVIHNGFPKNLYSFFKTELWHGKEIPKLMLKRKSMIFSNPCLFPLIYLIIFIFILISVIIRNNLLLLTSLTFLFFIPLILSFITNLRQKTIKFVLPLTLLYFIYGLARVICFINPKNYKNKCAKN